MINQLTTKLSYREIERKCEMPVRTIKAGRQIPQKYHKALEELHHVLFGATITKDLCGDSYVIKNGVVGMQDNHIFRRISLPDGNYFIKKV